MLRLPASFVALLFVIAKILAEDVCENNGTPLTGTHQKCDCPTGFKGFDCSEKVTVCEGNPCRNSAVCVDKDDGTFTCKCQPNYEGILCEKKVRPCNLQPCKNKGNCSDDGVKCFKCECPDGFKGFDCSKKVLPCEVSPCQNGGVCSNEEDGSFKCTCTTGYTGLVCTRKETLFASTVLEGNSEWTDQLQQWLPSQLQETKMKLCYRASDNGWASSTFHQFCDNKGPTVVLVKVGKYVFGGYAAAAWGGSARYIKADTSFIFSFSNRDDLAPFKSPVYQNNANAMYTNNGYGPTFGGGHDIHIANNANGGTSSYTNFGHTYKPPSDYKYTTNAAKRLLAGSYNFTPSDVEVYYFANSK
ncbi:basement membrane-specific heparan sulfate proteoglycan core -like [Paramuricea clavata]|uniref:Basement membrane-specific heparan sulfate proteoglycan core -like n=1 Tax=Paramuricea clavata TaxID=317549 RepID=A0A6S7HDZ9_PARCT|nr:basement membrane-specific heparan sulfate proteoglycan core -like [Paramuricea clavata]